jgi:hypothetical protein
MVLVMRAGGVAGCCEAVFVHTREEKNVQQVTRRHRTHLLVNVVVGMDHDGDKRRRTRRRRRRRRTVGRVENKIQKAPGKNCTAIC